jgi:hypothetical protein
MGFNDFMAKVRYWDNQSAKWIIRHFYILFFEAFLVLIFILFFYNTIQVLDLSADVSKESIIERLLLAQSFNGLLIVLLMLLNSFWMLHIFNGIIRFRSLLREMNYNLTRIKNAK